MPVSTSQKVLHAIRQLHLCRCHDTLIVGVSGGADSVALLDLLVTLPDIPLTLVVAHLNHQLRGEESAADERFVRKLAAQYNLSCEVRCVDVRQLARLERMTLEEAGRKARYAFFEELRYQYHAVATAVGHHADDQAETFLLRLLRGAGTTGLTSMSPVNQACIIRPLLELTRQELREYLSTNGIAFREDSSNTDQNYLRNRIRHELLPLLQEYNPAIAQRLAATACLLREDETLLSHCTENAFQQINRSGSGWAALPQRYLKQQPRPLRLRLYRKSIETILGDLKRFERRHHQLLDELLLEGTTGARLNLPRNVIAVLTAGHLLFAHREHVQIPPPCRCTINGPGMYELGNGLSLFIDQALVPDSWEGIAHTTTYVNPDLAPFPWQVRPIIPGERMELLGMKGSRAVQDILTDLKFPHYLRRSLPLIICDEMPLWLAGVRRTRLALVQPDQKRAVRITLSGKEKMPLFP